MSLPTGQELLTLLTSGDPGLAKHALQTLCYAIESGKRVDLARDPRIYAAVVRLKSTPDVLVWRWLYKLVALLEIEQLVPWLEGQLAGLDTDPENISWAAGALHLLVGDLNARKRLTNLHVDPNDPVVRLAAGYFRGGTPVEGDVLRQATGSDNPLAHRWLSLRYGKDPTTVPKGVLSDLVTSTTSSVVEYAVWAVHNDPRGRILDVPLFPQDFATFPPKVRRWYVRVILKDSGSFLPYGDILHKARLDEQSSVREGLALGLADVSFDRSFADELTEWFAHEPDPLVRFAIARALYVKRRRYPNLFEALQTESESEDSIIGRAFMLRRRQPRPSRIFLPMITNLKTRSARMRGALPTIIRDSQENVYLLGIDTVDFSKRTDNQQYAIFRDLLDSLRHEEVVAAEKVEDIAVILTGDGVFVGFRNIKSRLAPLRLALRLRHSFRTLRAYNLRFGVNSGPATWIFFDEGGPQLISHAVNWTARVMSAAGENQILVSDSYYQQYVRPAVDELPGTMFEQVDGLQTKHAEALAVWEISS